MSVLLSKISETVSYVWSMFLLFRLQSDEYVWTYIPQGLKAIYFSIMCLIEKGKNNFSASLIWNITYCNLLSLQHLYLVSYAEHTKIQKLSTQSSEQLISYFLNSRNKLSAARTANIYIKYHNYFMLYYSFLVYETFFSGGQRGSSTSTSSGW
jgi:hypothetical protein